MTLIAVNKESAKSRNVFCGHNHNVSRWYGPNQGEIQIEIWDLVDQG